MPVDHPKPAYSKTQSPLHRAAATGSTTSPLHGGNGGATPPTASKSPSPAVTPKKANRRSSNQNQKKVDGGLSPTEQFEHDVRARIKASAKRIHQAEEKERMMMMQSAATSFAPKASAPPPNQIQQASGTAESPSVLPPNNGSSAGVLDFSRLDLSLSLIPNFHRILEEHQDDLKGVTGITFNNCKSLCPKAKNQLLTVTLPTYFPNIITLDLIDDRVGDDELAQIGQLVVTGSLGSIRRLKLGDNAITADGVAAFVQQLRRSLSLEILPKPLAPHGSSYHAIGQLHLAGNPLGDKGVEALASLLLPTDRGTPLSILSLRNTGLTAMGAQRLAESLHNNSNLVELCLRNNNLSDKGVIALSAGLKSATSLTQLDLENVGLQREGASVLAAALTASPSKLRSLILARNQVQAEGASALADYLQSGATSLTELNIADCNLHSDGLRAVCEGVLSSVRQGRCALTTLKMPFNHVLANEPSGCLRDLATAMSQENCSLLTVNLQDCHLHAVDVASVLQALVCSTARATNLNLKRNFGGHAAAMALKEVVARNTCVKTIEIIDNEIEGDDCAAVIEALETVDFSRLGTLELGGQEDRTRPFKNALAHSDRQHVDRLLAEMKQKRIQHAVSVSAATAAADGSTSVSRHPVLDDVPAPLNPSDLTAPPLASVSSSTATRPEMGFTATASAPLRGNTAAVVGGNLPPLGPSSQVKRSFSSTVSGDSTPCGGVTPVSRTPVSTPPPQPQASATGLDSISSHGTYGLSPVMSSASAGSSFAFAASVDDGTHPISRHTTPPPMQLPPSVAFNAASTSAPSSAAGTPVVNPNRHQAGTSTPGVGGGRILQSSVPPSPSLDAWSVQGSAPSTPMSNAQNAVTLSESFSPLMSHQGPQSRSASPTPPPSAPPASSFQYPQSHSAFGESQTAPTSSFPLGARFHPAPTAPAWCGTRLHEVQPFYPSQTHPSFNHYQQQQPQPNQLVAPPVPPHAFPPTPLPLPSHPSSLPPVGAPTPVMPIMPPVVPQAHNQSHGYSYTQQQQGTAAFHPTSAPRTSEKANDTTSSTAPTPVAASVAVAPTNANMSAFSPPTRTSSVPLSATSTPPPAAAEVSTLSPPMPDTVPRRTTASTWTSTTVPSPLQLDDDAARGDSDIAALPSSIVANVVGPLFDSLEGQQAIVDAMEAAAAAPTATTTTPPVPSAKAAGCTAVFTPSVDPLASRLLEEFRCCGEKNTVSSPLVNSTPLGGNADADRETSSPGLPPAPPSSLAADDFPMNSAWLSTEAEGNDVDDELFAGRTLGLGGRTHSDPVVPIHNDAWVPSHRSTPTTPIGTPNAVVGVAGATGEGLRSRREEADNDDEVVWTPFHSF